MLLWMLLVGGVIAIATVIMSYIELMPFLKALKQLNNYTSNLPTIRNRMMYLPRFISLLPMAWPPLMDIGLAAACGLLGLNGGVIGALIGLIISFAASVALKVHRHIIAPRMITNSQTWRTV